MRPFAARAGFSQLGEGSSRSEGPLKLLKLALPLHFCLVRVSDRQSLLLHREDAFLVTVSATQGRGWELSGSEVEFRAGKWL